jgi:GAF domain-containing protein
MCPFSALATYRATVRTRRLTTGQPGNIAYMTGEWASLMADVARELQAEPDERQTLERITKTAVGVVHGCTSASITLSTRKRGLQSTAATDIAAEQADARQYELSEGPCVLSALDRKPVYSGDLHQDDRFPRWGPWAVGLGFRSALAVPLFTDDQVYGALNLFSSQRYAFTEGAQEEAGALAAHAAVALDAQRQVEGLSTAVANRTVIGQAQGIVMERYGLSAQRAFDLLCRLSSTEERKLSAVAEAIVRTRELP